MSHIKLLEGKSPEVKDIISLSLCLGPLKLVTKFIQILPSSTLSFCSFPPVQVLTGLHLDDAAERISLEIGYSLDRAAELGLLFLISLPIIHAFGAANLDPKLHLQVASSSTHFLSTNSVPLDGSHRGQDQALLRLWPSSTTPNSSHCPSIRNLRPSHALLFLALCFCFCWPLRKTSFPSF